MESGQLFSPERLELAAVVSAKRGSALPPNEWHSNPDGASAYLKGLAFIERNERRRLLELVDETHRNAIDLFLLAETMGTPHSTSEYIPGVVASSYTTTRKKNPRLMLHSYRKTQ